MRMVSANKYLHLIVLFFLPALACLPQVKKVPVARFSFNNASASDEITGHRAKLVGASFTEDRFDNPGNAVFLSGSIYSYINLGNYKALKPDSGTISLWINMATPVWSGLGVEINPILLTKCTELSDFFEAYAIYYMLGSGRVVAVFSRDSIRQSSAYGKVLSNNSWHHLLLTYNYNHGSFYLDGELSLRLLKKFPTKFLATDSVMLGSFANKKNSRYFNGAIDDVEFYDRVLSDAEIQDLYHAPDPDIRNKFVRKWVWPSVTAIGIIVLLYFGIKYRLKKELIKEKQQLELTNKILETELRVNRALMNPHFVFNSLNSLQNFIMSKDYIQANGYLVKFSKLMRKLLDSNISSMLSLEQEIEFLKTYMELEDVRFEKGISYSIETDADIIPSSLDIPVMLLQPFVENAIWHGLLKKKGDRLLKISFSRRGTDYIQCRIADNGVGRQNAVTNPSEKKSLATIFVMQRLDLLNKIHGLACTLTIEDKPEGQGTVVTLLLPIFKRHYDTTGHHH